MANTLAYNKIKIINLAETFTGPISKGRLLALLENIRLGWKWMKMTNTPAYYKINLIIPVEAFTGDLPTVPENIRLGWKWMNMTNTLAC